MFDVFGITIFVLKQVTGAVDVLRCPISIQIPCHFLRALIEDFRDYVGVVTTTWTNVDF